MSPKNKKKQNEEFCVDFLEREMNESLREDFERLLDHSPESQESLKELTEIRNTLNVASHEINCPESQKYYDDLHSKIMGAVKNESVQSPVVVQLFTKNTLKYAASVALMVVGAGVIWQSILTNSPGPIPAGVEVAKNSQWILEGTARDPEVVPDTVITHEGEVDVYMDVTSKRLEGMTDEQVNQLFDRLSR